MRDIYTDYGDRYETGKERFVFEPNTRTLRICGEGNMHYRCVADGMGDIAFIALWETSKPEIRRIVVEDGVRTIGIGAFYGCMLAESISLPKSVRIIDSYAFSGCASLRSIDIPENVELINDRFLRCCGLEEINVSESNPYYYSRDGVLFSRDGTLLVYPPNKAGETYRVPDDTKNVAKCAFLEAQHLKEVILPEGFDGSRPAHIRMRTAEPQE